jgi:hypothetical protein
MNEDTVLREHRALPYPYAQTHWYDVGAMVADLREQDERGDRQVVRLTPRRPLAVGVSHSEAAPDTAP